MRETHGEPRSTVFYLALLSTRCQGFYFRVQLSIRAKSMKRTPLQRRTPLKPSRKPMGEKTHGRRYFTSAMKRAALVAAAFECEYCGASLGFDNAVADHRIPWPEGPTELWNLAVCCASCNRQKLRMSAEEFAARIRNANAAP